MVFSYFYNNNSLNLRIYQNDQTLNRDFEPLNASLNIRINNHLLLTPQKKIDLDVRPITSKIVFLVIVWGMGHWWLLVSWTRERSATKLIRLDYFYVVPDYLCLCVSELK